MRSTINQSFTGMRVDTTEVVNSGYFSLMAPNIPKMLAGSACKQLEW